MTKGKKVKAPKAPRKPRTTRDRKAIALNRIGKLREHLLSLPMPKALNERIFSAVNVAIKMAMDTINATPPEAFFAQRKKKEKHEIAKGDKMMIREKYAPIYPMIANVIISVMDVIMNEGQTPWLEVERPDGRRMNIPLKHVVQYVETQPSADELTA